MKGWLRSGCRYSLSWNMDGDPCGSISYTPFEGYLMLDFRVRDYGEDEWTAIEQKVCLDRTPVHFGGRRLWFRCPRCQRRCRILYGGSRFYCRKCYRLKYRSQGEDSVQRAITRAQAIRKRLGGFEGIDDPFPPKPKGMHWKTYKRLEALDDSTNERMENALLKWMLVFEKKSSQS